MVYVTPGHPVKDGAGYDCNCGECLYQRERSGESQSLQSVDDKSA